VVDVLSMLYPQQQIGLWGLDDNGLAQVKDRSRRQNHGVYAASGVTLNQPGYRNTSSALFDGSAGYANVYSAGLAADFNAEELTLAILVKMLNATVMGDGQQRYGARFAADANNTISLWKNGSAQLVATYTAGGTAKNVTVSGHNDPDWFWLVLTVSKAADALKLYKFGMLGPGGQIGSTQTSLGVWAGALAANLACLGAASTTPTTMHSGWLMGGALWTKAIPEQDLQYAAAQLFA
jgi:hypothetical protein